MKHFKKMSTVAAFFLVLAAGLATVAPAAEIEVEGDAYVALESMYLWRGMDLSAESDFVVSAGMDLSVGGFTLSYWGNWDEDTNKLNETDLTLDYSFDLSELVSVSLGDVLYAVDSTPDAHEAYLSLALNCLLSPSATLYWDWDEAEEDGLFYVAAIGHEVAIGEKLTLLLGAEASYNQNSDFQVGDYSAWHNGELSVGIDYAVHDQITLSPLYRFSTPLSDKSEDLAEIDDESYLGMTVLLTF